MRIDTDFHAAYRALEKRMKALAVADGDVFLPNPEPEGPVDYVFICMEPSRSWAGSAEEAEAKVKEGFRNFLVSIDVQILHFCIRSYLCKSTPRYHITDFSKGAMFVKHARRERNQRWDRWYPLLQEEINHVAPSDAAIVAVGSEVFRHLKRLRFQRRLTQIIHYSPLAGRARNAAIEGHEDSFEAFKGSVPIEDVVATAKQVLRDARVPDKVRAEALSRLEGKQITTSRQKLIFNYKLAFEKMRASRA
jgi:hypothetical protein